MHRLINQFSTNPRILHGNLYVAGFKLTPEGDCCASCYIQHVSGAEALYDAMIFEVETIDSSPEMQAQDTDTDCVSESWGHRIRTSKGYCTIEMRLDHNGYYGGSLECTECENVPESATTLDDF